MGILIQDNSAVFTHFISGSLPTKNLVGLWDLRGGGSGIINSVTGVAAEVVGSPEYLTEGTKVTHKDGFITDVALTGERTYVVLCSHERESYQSVIPISDHNYSDETKNGNIYGVSNSGILAGGVTGGGYARILPENISYDLSKFTVYIMTLKPSRIDIYAYDGSELLSGSGTNSRLVEALPFRIGAYYPENATGAHEGTSMTVRLAAAYDKAMDASGVEGICKSLKSMVTALRVS